MKQKRSTKLAPKKRAMKRKGRDARGRFAEGNSGGPGRPRRAVEREYLAVLSDAVPLARWKKMVGQVADFAEQGERWALEWLSGYLLGEPQTLSLSITELATREALGIDADLELKAEVDAVENPPSPFDPLGFPTLLERALKLERAAFRLIVGERIEAEPELQPYRAEISESPSWREYDYLKWVLTAPVGEIVAWAQAQADIERALQGDVKALQRIREITAGGE
jgi:hypothetical protein